MIEHKLNYWSRKRDFVGRSLSATPCIPENGASWNGHFNELQVLRQFYTSVYWDYHHYNSDLSSEPTQPHSSLLEQLWIWKKNAYETINKEREAHRASAWASMSLEEKTGSVCERNKRNFVLIKWQYNPLVLVLILQFKLHCEFKDWHTA